MWGAMSGLPPPLERPRRLYNFGNGKLDLDKVVAIYRAAFFRGAPIDHWVIITPGARAQRISIDEHPLIFDEWERWIRRDTP